VKILDGGRKKWEAEGRPQSNSVKVLAAGNARPKDANPALRAHLQDVLAVARIAGETAPLLLTSFGNTTAGRGSINTVIQSLDAGSGITEQVNKSAYLRFIRRVEDIQRQVGRARTRRSDRHDHCRSNPG